MSWPGEWEGVWPGEWQGAEGGGGTIGVLVASIGGIGGISNAAVSQIVEPSQPLGGSAGGGQARRGVKLVHHGGHRRKSRNLDRILRSEKDERELEVILRALVSEDLI